LRRGCRELAKLSPRTISESLAPPVRERAVPPTSETVLYVRYNISDIVARVHAKVRRWGSSLGIVVPSEVAKGLRLKAGDEVVLEIDQAGIEDAFGSLRDWTVDPQKLKDELRRGW